MEKPIPLEKLVKKGELTQEACERMKKYWVTNANELYCFIKSATTYGTDEMITHLAQDLGISKDKLLAYAEYIKPYVSKSVLNPFQTSEHPTGCLIPEE